MALPIPREGAGSYHPATPGTSAVEGSRGRSRLAGARPARGRKLPGRGGLPWGGWAQQAWRMRLASLVVVLLAACGGDDIGPIDPAHARYSDRICQVDPPSPDFRLRHAP